MIAIDGLGNKICIIGCSSSGKSTLANKLSSKLNIPVTHLDFLAHYADSDWQRRPDQELVQAHDEILKNNKWILEGNYSVCMSQRFAKATSIIWIDPNVYGAAYRSIKRSFFPGKNRIGKLPGAQKNNHFWLINHILSVYPKNRKKYQGLLSHINIPIVRIHSIKELNDACKQWQIDSCIKT